VNPYTPSQRINKIETTSDTLTSRGGLALFSRYIEQVGILGLLEDGFGQLRKSRKGLAIWKLFYQVLCFFFDGTSRHLTYFDQLKKDEGYAGAIQMSPEEMASSHSVKRFFKLFSWVAGGVFRKVLRRMFLWRLRIEHPDVIELGLDSMVMDNDEAEKRHGASPTPAFAGVKGFQPLQITWQGKVVDAIFRGGKKHCNFGHTVVHMITDLVTFIRTHYREDVTILLRVDAGFFDEENFTAFDALGIGFTATGKMYEYVQQHVAQVPQALWERYDNGHQGWEFVEFGYRCDSWGRFWRALYTRPVDEQGQMLLTFARPENVILTNIGVNAEVLKHLPKTEQNRLKKPQTLIANHHLRGADELTFRGLKDFGFEQLPFLRFPANSAFYYCMVMAFFLFETFKEDVLSEIIPIASYATTVRRVAVDFAAKIVKTSHQIILKVSQAVRTALNLDRLWQRCQCPPPIRA